MKEPGLIARSIKALSQIEKNELKATFVSAFMAFILLGSYYVLRAPRDSLASEWSNSEVAFLWQLNFYVSAVLVSLFGLAVCKFRLKHVIAGVYVLFAASFVFLMLVVSTEEATDPELVATEQAAEVQTEPTAGEEQSEPAMDSVESASTDATANTESPEESSSTEPPAENSSSEDTGEEAEESAGGFSFDKAFYLWVSVFALFNTSAFWIFMTDMFTKAQSKRLFAVIAAGASAGTLAGPPIPTLLGGVLSQVSLILIASIGLLLVVPMIFYLYHLKGSELDNADLVGDTPALGGQWWQGFKTFATSPFLLGIAAFILLYVFIGSFVYFQQKELLAEFSRAERTQILGGIDWIVNTLTFTLALSVTGHIVNRLGMPTALALMPVLMCLALLILAFAPVITVLLALQVVRRGGNYGLTRPAREMLFTRISPEDRFKSKPVVDIVVYRGGDAVAGSLFAILTDKVGMGLASVAVVGSGIAALWGWVGVKLGRRFDEDERDVEQASVATRTTQA
ncbi:MAG: hypothetical protein QNI99_03740 [Woeseiaceae bacterium]|nr:hypothetical protein [Woeseiaceae bacterium]